MDKVFEKFGVYDIIGIWIPGALTVTYFLLTMRDLLSCFFSNIGIDINGLSDDYIMIILYTAVAFFIGIVLHEIGKVIADLIPCFKLSKINTRIYEKEIKMCPRILVFKRIRYEYQQSHIGNKLVKNKKVEDFEKAISELKYNKNINTSRVDKYHSIYALSRSLCLCFIIHAIIMLFSWNPFLLIADILFAHLFYLRTYRYFHSWVKNVYLQYYKEKQ